MCDGHMETMYYNANFSVNPKSFQKKKKEFKRNPLYSTWILPARTKNISWSILFGRNEDTNL